MRLALTSVTAALLAGAALFGCNGDNNGPKPPGPPDHIVAVNGLYYKADSLDLKPLVFAVADANGTFLPDQQILLNLLSGDGALSDLAITTDSTGTASFTYEFTGSKGHAVIQLAVINVDQIEILIRRSVIKPVGPGSPGQAQYLLLTDTYRQVRGFNGTPDRVDDTSFTVGGFTTFLVIPVYESSLGVVAVLDDLDEDAIPDLNEPVLGIIVNTIYSGTTDDTIPIGIGSPLSDVRTTFGVPDSLGAYLDTVTSDSAVEIYYWDLDMLLFGGFDADTTTEEIQLIEGLEMPTAAATRCPLLRRRY